MGDVNEDTHNIQQPVNANDGNNRQDASTLSYVVRIHKVPEGLKEHHDYVYYFVPKAVSLGPFHHNGKPEFEAIEKLKTEFTNRLVLGNKELLKNLNEKLSEMVKELRGYYDLDVTRRFSDEEFTTMMLLDGCFILYLIKEYENRDGLDVNVDLVENDIFLMENQIPYQVLIQVMKLVPDDKWDVKIKRFVDSNFLVTKRCQKSNSLSDDETFNPIPSSTTYLLEILQTRLTKENCWCREVYDRIFYRRASGLEILNVICRPNTSGSLACYRYDKNRFFSSILQIPPITVHETTKGMFLNLVGHEMYAGHLNSPISKYLVLLNFLIADVTDVRILRKTGVITNFLGRDRRVVEMVKEIRESLRMHCSGLEGNCVACKHTDGQAIKRDATYTYIKSLCVFVAIFCVFLTWVQRYLSVWDL